MLPVALAVGLAVGVASPEARPGPAPEVADDSYKPIDEQPKRELDTRALRSMVVAGLVGAVGVYFVGRWIVRSKRGDKKAIEVPEPLRGALERIRPEERRHRALPEYPGRRGKIVRAYLQLLAAAERAGFARKPDETPAEFARALDDPRAPLASATDAFERARYSALELGDADVARAERDVAAVVEHLQHRPRRRRRVVKEEDGVRS
jgi:hypothetical protein